MCPGREYGNPETLFHGLLTPLITDARLDIEEERFVDVSDWYIA